MPSNRDDNVSIQRLPPHDRPRERLWQQGPGALSSAELLAILLRTGTASENALRLSQRILAHYQDLGRLGRASAQDLRRFNGLGEVKIAQILAAIELGKRIAGHTSANRQIIHSAADAAALLNDMAELPQEHVRVILLDAGQRVIAISTVYVGTMDASLLRVPEVFREAITCNASAVIVAHNHPSGDPTPSPEDVEVTRALGSAARILDIALADHLIIARRGWASLREMGLGF